MALDAQQASQARDQFSPRDSSPDTAIGDRWSRVSIRHIEDLKDAVYGAGLRATQMSSTPVAGSLVHADRDGIIYSSGLINGRVALTGPLSESMITLGVGIIIAPGTRHWLREVKSGAAGVFLAGDEHDALYFPGSLYATVTLSALRAEEAAARAGRILDVRKLGGSGVDSNGLSPAALRKLERGFELVHSGRNASGICDTLLSCLIEHFGHLPRLQIGPAEYRGYSKIVRRGRAYIIDNLSMNLTVDSVAAAIGTSSRTLFRAFHEILGETPLQCIRRLRLHSIRRDLLRGSDAAASVTAIANQWGIGELGRLSGWYRELFAELPSCTLARASTRRARRRRAGTILAGFA